jgi:hypothetical protein
MADSLASKHYGTLCYRLVKRSKARANLPMYDRLRKGREMKPITFLLISLSFLLISLSFAGPAAAGTVNGNGALALAALVGNVSPYVSATKKRVLSKLLDGHSNFSFPSGHTISVNAKRVNCRASNVDIKSHSCELKFGTHNVALHGRRAHEVFATMAEIGVPSEGAAGSIYEALSNLHCTIDPNEVKQNSGGGAHCHYVSAH